MLTICFNEFLFSIHAYKYLCILIWFDTAYHNKVFMVLLWKRRFQRNPFSVVPWGFGVLMTGGLLLSWILGSIYWIQGCTLNLLRFLRQLGLFSIGWNSIDLIILLKSLLSPLGCCGKIESVWRSMKDMQFFKFAKLWLKSWACLAHFNFKIEKGMTGSIFEPQPCNFGK